MAAKTVMVVDDSSTIRKIIQRELSNADYEVILAKNGMEALAVLEWADPLPDLLSLDIDMPKMNGFELCSRLRAGIDAEEPRKRAIAEIPVIFVSANDTIENRERGYELEVIDFITKPFSPGKLLDTFNKVLNSQEQFCTLSALVVEDSPFIRRITRNILARHGLKEIYTVSNGEQALELLKEKQFAIDIVITDYIMPGMTGKQLCRTLRGIEQFANIPIFFISSVDTKETVLDFFKAGASDYLPKPFIEEEFRARVVTHLRNRSYLKELEALNRKLKFQAEHDGLTQLYNRGHFQKELGTLFSQNTHSGTHLGCILIDLDFFKQVNDTYGHTYGDLVLRDFASILTQDKRSTDLVARYGGEEFVILLPGADLTESLSVAEQLRKRAEDKIYNDGKTELQVTISAGVSSLQDHKPDHPDKLLTMADKALYQAKKNGRNRVECYCR